MLGNHVHARALAQVVMAPVLAVDVDDHRVPRLRRQRAVRLVDDARLQAVQHARVQAVLAAVAQHKARIAREVPVLKERVVEAAHAELAVRLDIQALLRHVQRILAHHAETHALTELLHAVLVVILDPAGEPVLRPVGRVLPRTLFGHVVIRSLGEHAVFLVPEVVRIGRQADDGHRVIGGDQVRLGDDLRRLHALAVGARADDRVGAHLDGLRVDGGALRRVGAVRRIAHDGVRRHADADRRLALQRTLVEAAGHLDGGLFRVAREAQTVRLARRGRAVIEQARLTERAAVGGVVHQLRDDHLIENVALRVGQADRLAGFLQIEVGKIINAVLGRLRLVAVDDQVAVVFDRHIGELPLARLLDVVGQAVTLEVDGLSAHVVDLNIIVGILDVRADNGSVAGHDFGDVKPGGVGQTHGGVHGGLAGAGVRHPRRGLGEDLEGAVALLVAAPGGVRLQVVVGDQVEHAALDVGENDGFAVGAELEAGVRPAAVRAGAVLAGGVDDVIAARLDDRALRETPLDQ